MQAHMTQKEVAERLGMTRGNVAIIEMRALAKLRKHPVMQRLAEECGVMPFIQKPARSMLHK